MRNSFGFAHCAKQRRKTANPLFSTIAAAAALSGFASPAPAQVSGGGSVYIPVSSIEQQTNPKTVSFHTNVRIMIPSAGIGSIKASPNTAATKGLPPVAGYNYETPASLGCVYQLVKTIVTGCNPNKTVTNPAGGSKAIAIVDAYDDPHAAADLANFSTQFGLAAPNLTVVYASGKKPPVDSSGGWEVEESLDIEWAHAMAPGARIYLVEAASSDLTDLLTAVKAASTLVAAAGGGEVSMSWGASEFPAEKTYDTDFTTAKVVYIASAGDSPGTEWPSTSPNIVSAGGTTTGRNPTTGIFQQETSWQVTGGGISAYEARPSYQNAISSIVGNLRGVPDIAFDADPSTGVWALYNSQWYIVGGTSLSAPALAGIINAAGSFSASTSAQLTKIYKGLGSPYFHDISSGNCGPYGGYLASAGWDACSGVGSPVGLTNL